MLKQVDFEFAKRLGKFASVRGGTFRNIGHAIWEVRDVDNVPQFVCFALQCELRSVGLVEVH